ncbi:MAG TPA: Crp/Fnr family transcriptional regulator [Bacillota bacterium]|nr:Crp/Fnr family transcriptional regulator [Bacillota bacterium]
MFICSRSNRISPILKEGVIRISTVQKYKKNQIVFMDGEKADKFYLIKSGRARVCKTTAEGKDLLLKLCQTDELVGELVLFQEGITYTTSAQMLEPGELYVFQRPALEALLEHNPHLCVEFMRWIGILYRLDQSKLRDFILHGKNGALYSILIRLSNSYGRKVSEGILIDFPIKIQDLARMIGTPRETISRILSELKDLNILEMQDGSIIIYDLEYLKSSICCDNCPTEICQI